MKIAGLLFLSAVSADQQLQGHVGYPKHHPIPPPPHYGEPLYSCPKPGWELIGDECVLEVRVPSRLECPPGFLLEGHHCVRWYEPTVYCPWGVLIGGICRQVDVCEPLSECPPDTLVDEAGCFVLESIAPIEVCPGATIRSKGGCLAVEYAEPALVCPPDTIPDGKKCRREIINWKMKKGRLLSEMDASEEILDAQSKKKALRYEDVMMDDYGYADIALVAGPGLVSDCALGDCYDQWVPATPEVKVKTRKVKQPVVSEQMKWEKVKVPVSAPKVKDVKVKVPEVKVKPVKEKAVKTPHEVVKVVSQAAEKVCPVGAKHGSTCVVESIVPPVLECPIPSFGSQCAQRIPVPAVPVCPFGDLICDAIGICRCEKIIEFPPTITCAGDHPILGGRCLIELPAQRLCPLGFFLDFDGYMCIRREVEPAVCVRPVFYPQPVVRSVGVRGIAGPGQFLMDAGEEY